ncbi:MAG: type IX secretion system membrane protein PorP/SprF [Bacteroidales bacterium]|jgi:type IX secretion system PorP/SprF family membrane protein|nr:type IX secretion system membrane protein PorP/SprF [Bacteroidales bacterium]
MIFKKTSIITVCIAVALIGSCTGVSGQQSQPFTQYLFSRFLLNPAACGADGYTSVGLTIKDQWSGFSAAPSNQTLTGQMRLPREGLFGNRTRRYGGGFNPENVGLGVALFNDMRGPIRTTGGQFTYAYHLEDRYGQLSFGLTASLFQLYIDRDKVDTELGHDIYIDGNKLSSFIPDASFGLHYTTKDYYAGFSASNLFQSFLSFGGRNSSDYRIERQYLMLGGYVFEVNREWSIVPGAQIKFNEHGVGQIDLNIMGYYYDQFWGGISYRSGGGGAAGGTSLIFGARYKQYYFGYAFDYTLSSIRKYSYGSHELMLSITFGQSERFFRYKRRYEFQNSGQSGRR